MIDLHSHILPELDDGASSVEESIDILKDSFSQGVEVCVATPHCRIHSIDSFSDFLDKRENSVQKVSKNLSDIGNIPKVLVGAEVCLDNDISIYGEDLLKKLCITGTNCMLVEFPSLDQIDERIFECIYSISNMGIKPVIAHVFRYRPIDDIFDQLSVLNPYYQINAYRFLSFSGMRLVKRYMHMVDNFIVASDVHHMDVRSSKMSLAYNKVQKKISNEVAETLFKKNVRKLFSKAK